MRLLSRAVVVVVAAVVFTLVSIQFARIINENVAMAHSLADVQTDVTHLRAHKEWQMREIRRLSNPDGAIPEIHDRLHLVGPNETIIYVRPTPPASQ
jgi:hypothetical protein